VDEIKIVWDSEASESFRNQLNHIKEDSTLAAEKVRQDILVTVSKLSMHPEMFPPDRFKNHNSGKYRAFEKHSLRIAYLITENQVRILRVRHIKQEPEFY
jgi:plasmid stabilization system protein ParE